MFVDVEMGGQVIEGLDSFRFKNPKAGMDFLPYRIAKTLSFIRECKVNVRGEDGFFVFEVEVEAHGLCVVVFVKIGNFCVGDKGRVTGDR